jgi:thiamine-phosphate pyrophosphorylase
MTARRRLPPELLIFTEPIDTPAAIDSQVECMRAALEGAAGASHRVAVQLRAKALTARHLHTLGQSLREVTQQAGVALLVNGRADVAHAVKADGVHLPEGGLRPAEVRRVLSEGALVGVSTHDAAGLAAAAADGADYATLGPFAPTPGKGPPLGEDAFATMVRTAALPVLALGGVKSSNAATALRAGAHGVAVIRAVTRAADPAAAVCALLDALDRVRGEGG